MQLTQLNQFVVCRLDDQRYALPLAAIERIVRAVEVTVLPHQQGMVLGVINMAGDILPVLSLRRRLGLPERPVVPADQFLIARTSLRTVALVIDEAQELIERTPAEIARSTHIAPGFSQIQGVVKVDDDLVLILDPEAWMGPEDAQALDKALTSPVAHAA